MSRRITCLIMTAVAAGLVPLLSAQAGQVETRSNPVANGAIVIDGNFGDWAGVAAYTADGAGDAPAGDQDWVQAAVAHDDTYIYLRLDRTAASTSFNGAPSGSSTGGQGYWVLLDTDKSHATGLNLAGVRPFSVGAEFNLGGIITINRWGAGGIGCHLGAFQLASVSALSPTELELVISRGALGSPTEFNIQMLGENSGDYYPDDSTKAFHYSTVGALDPLPEGIAASRSNPVPNGSIVMNSDVSDWAAVVPYPSDPAGDGGATQDWVSISIAHDDNNFYFRLGCRAGAAALTSAGYWGWIDTDRSNTTGVKTIGGHPLSVGGEYNFGGSAAINQWNQDGGYVTTFGWAGAGQPGPTSVEAALRRTDIGDPPDFNLVFVGETSGDYYPEGGVADDWFHYSVHPPGPTGGQAEVVEERSNTVANGSIVIDGDTSDWAGVTPYSADASGDGGTSQDWVQSWIAHDDTNFYFRLERTAASTPQSAMPLGQGYWVIMDTDSNTASGFTGFGARSFSIGGEYNFSGVFALNQWNTTGCFSGTGLPFVASPTPPVVDAEVAISRINLGNPSEFNLAFRGEQSGDYYPDGATGADYFHYTMGTPVVPLPPGMLQSLSNQVADGAIVMDGNLSDWSGVTPFMADASGDGGAQEDWVQVWVAHDSANIYMRLKRTPGSALFTAPGYWGLIDTDRNAGTGIKLAGPIGAEYNTGGINAINQWNSGGGHVQSFAYTGVAVPQVQVPTTYELAVSRADMGNPSRFNVIFVGENSGDYYPEGANANKTFRYATQACNTPFADADNDDDVDMDDFGAWQACFTGDGIPMTTGCACFDRDFGGQGDGDVDLMDFNAFLNCASGPAVPADPGCGNE